MDHYCRIFALLFILCAIQPQREVSAQPADKAEDSTPATEESSTPSKEGVDQKSPIAFFLGSEFSNANGLDKTKMSPAFGISYGLPLVSTGENYALKIEFATSAHLTQTANIRECRSCRRTPIIIGNDTLQGGPSVGAMCAPLETVGDTVFRTALMTDSIVFNPVSVLRLFAQSRIEFMIGRDSYRIGLVLGAGIQNNPNGLSDPQQQRLRPLYAIGGGIRKLTSKGEVFSLDIVYGGVQNQAQRDELLVGTQTITRDMPVQRTSQWQAFLNARVNQTLRIRVISSFGAPPPTRIGSLPVPDLLRVGLLFESDFGAVVKALLNIGSDEEEEGKGDGQDDDEKERTQIRSADK